MPSLRILKTRRSSWLRGSSACGQTTRGTQRPMCEPLEARTVLSAVVDSAGTLVIIGTAAREVVRIERGETTLIGGVVVRGVPGVPDGTMFTGVSRVSVDLRSGSDSFSAQGALLSASGGWMNVRVLGGFGNDTLYATTDPQAGDMDFRGGSGSDYLEGGRGNDRLEGGKGNDSLVGVQGNDTLRGQQGNDSIRSGPGDDTLLGGEGVDVMWGGGGVDVVNGGKGPDVLWGGAGQDLCYGEGGADRFNCADAEAMDFVVGDGNYHASFTQTPSRVLLPMTFWEWMAVGESPLSGNIDSRVVDAATALADAAFSSAGLRRLIPGELAGLTNSQRTLLLENLQAVTFAFRQSIVATPNLFTTQRFEQLFDDLDGVAVNAPASIEGLLGLHFEVLRTQLTSRGFPALVRRMLPNAPDTTGFLTGFEAVLNCVDDF